MATTLTQRDRDLILSVFGLPEVADRIIELLNAAGSGDVTGPGSSVDNTLPRFDGNTGAQIQGSGIVVDDSNNASGITSLALAQYEQFDEQTLAPATPAAGKQKIYFKNDGNIYKKNSAGVESALGGGITGPGTATIGDIPVFADVTGGSLNDTTLQYLSSVLQGSTDGGFAIGQSGNKRPSRGYATLSWATGAIGTAANSYLTSLPTRATFYAGGEAVIAGFAAETYAAGAGSVLTLRRALGTSTAPTAVTTNLALASYTGTGFDGTNFASCFEMATIATENYTPTTRGGKTTFLTTKTGTANRAERLNIDGNGDFNFALGTRMTLGGANISTSGNLAITGAALDGSTTTSFVALAGSIPDLVGSYKALDLVVNTTVGSNASAIKGLQLLLNAGYNGSGSTFGVAADNSVGGTAIVALGSPTGNYGFSISCGNPGTEHVAIYGQGYAGSKVWGVCGTATGDDPGGTAVGVYGGAQQSVGGGAVGGFFKCSTSAGTAFNPNSPAANAAIVCDNDDSGENIAAFLAAGGPVSIVDPLGNFCTVVAGVGFKIKEGSNARMGTATLIGGTITVSNTSITANTRIFYSVSTAGGVQGFLSSTQSAGASFTISSSNVADISSIVWELKEPA